MPVETQPDMPFGQLSREMLRLLDRYSRSGSAFTPPDLFAPPVNVYESIDSFIVCVELAGIDAESIDMHLSRHRLTLTGYRSMPACPIDILNTDAPASRPRVHVMEIDHGRFAREIEFVEPVDHESIHASYREGLLWIRVVKLA
jgi:HSP20 family protein